MKRYTKFWFTTIIANVILGIINYLFDADNMIIILPAFLTVYAMKSKVDWIKYVVLALVVLSFPSIFHYRQTSTINSEISFVLNRIIFVLSVVNLFFLFKVNSEDNFFDEKSSTSSLFRRLTSKSFSISSSSLFILKIWLTALLLGPVLYLIFGDYKSIVLSGSLLQKFNDGYFTYTFILIFSIFISLPFAVILIFILKKVSKTANSEHEAKIPIYIIGALCPYLSIIILSTNLPLFYSIVIIASTRYYNLNFNIVPKDVAPLSDL